MPKRGDIAGERNIGYGKILHLVYGVRGHMPIGSPSGKGLEFPVVFVVGCVAGIVPHSMSVDEGRENEERRLFYVALTRAKDHLHVSCFEAKKFGRGGTRYFDPSYFIQEAMEKPLAEATN